MAHPTLTPQELAAISAEFANPPAVDDAHSEMCGRIPNNAPGMRIQPPNPMQFAKGYGSFDPGMEAEEHATIPQDGMGVPSAKMFDPSSPRMPMPYGNFESPPSGGVPYCGGGISIYEDNGQKFMIKNGCIYKQTWTTIENGGECRMFDTRKGKKVSPKGIVIQKYDWIPLSVANAMAATPVPKMVSRKPIASDASIVKTPEHAIESTPAPENAKEDVCVNEPATKVVDDNTIVEPPKQKKEFKPIAKPDAKPAAKENGKKQVMPRKASPKIHNAGILTTKK